jgi:hypothetical protein
VARAAASSKRLRLSVDVSPEVRRRVRLAAARREVAVGRYVLEALEQRLSADLTADDLLALTARADPVLAELWDNPKDAEYDGV